MLYLYYDYITQLRGFAPQNIFAEAKIILLCFFGAPPQTPFPYPAFPLIASFVGLRPTPCKFFEKNLIKNFYSLELQNLEA